MRYIDHTNCKKAFEKGEDHEIQSLGKLIVTPIVLKPVFMSGNKTASDVPTTSKLVENYEQREKIGKTNR